MLGHRKENEPAHKQNDSGTSIKVMRKQLPQLVAKVVAPKASWPPPPLLPPHEAGAEHGRPAGHSSSSRTVGQRSFGRVFTSLVFFPFAEQPRFVGDARLGASRWFAGAVIHSLGARVALPRAEVPNVSSSEGYPSSCPIAYAQNNAVIARVK